ncbi:GNAT family N-acetyltransferase [Polaromonas sp. DSR2-3-2]|uniref:GNAT family N-acetyltransferase n=1 Tax=unclassified Polaromonas TaxID=2638319 RepID=UPI003CF3597E
MAVPIELLAAHHQRQGFDCGEPALNEFLQRQAGQLGRKGFGKTYVALDADGLAVVGFVTLSAGQVQTPRLPAGLKLPRYPAPILRMGRLGVNRRAQGQGVGRQLLSFALQLALEFSKSVGLYAVVVDAKHDKARAYYQSMGFTSTLDDPLCLYLPVSVLEKAKPERMPPAASRQDFEKFLKLVPDAPAQAGDELLPNTDK